MLNVTVGRAEAHENLTIFPLLAGGVEDLPYLLLVDAQAAGTLQIGEIADGTVRALLASNSGDRDVLVLDGEQLVGCRQNRMTNRSILLPAHSKTEIPVYCMEQGRWHFESQAMTPVQQHSPAKLRRRARDTEHRHVVAGMHATVNELSVAQSEFWYDVAETASHVGGHSATGAFNEIYEYHRSRIEQWLGAFALVDGQVGVAVFVGRRPLALDLIGSHRLFARVHRRLLRGYVVDAVEQLGRAPAPHVRRPHQPAAQRLLDAVRRAERVEAPTVGRGRYAVLTGVVVGGELMDGTRIAHLSAFPQDPGTSRPVDAPTLEHPLAAPSRRRHHRRGGA